MMNFNDCGSVLRRKIWWMEKREGIVHNSSYILWREGLEATPEVRLIAEKGSGEILEQRKGVRDVFAAGRILQGVGMTETIFYSDAKHTKVSVISKIVPSPDWFVGLDSIELCMNGYWLNNLTIEAGPIDAGTDEGFTFTAPNWASEPQSPISMITSKNPSHPANSFYYPYLNELPPLVTFHFIKERVYRANNKRLCFGPKHKKSKFSKISTVVVPLPDSTSRTLHKRLHARRIYKKAARRSVDCLLSEWSEWSTCSASCGVGFESRTRSILTLNKRGGTPCPQETRQTRWCGQQTNCIDKFFNW
ncbi:spondin-2 isoform X2 [Cephus cinctus]|uniref:Spondin-2 isoform X2 n=1 Tax=Cephus cinctus TaxID=211228 RepID=A0AAJ7R7T6_CEPCN|nr:spondin-2 isoform X2 [Cephus cinctus]